MRSTPALTPPPPGSAREGRIPKRKLSPRERAFLDYLAGEIATQVRENARRGKM
jgi:hypothetical protein